jgi:superfamily II DNA or RNA helicase
MTTELKKALTVRPKENAVGIRPKSFKVYRENPDGTLQIPRFFKQEETKKFHKGSDAPTLKFQGTLRPHQKEALKAFKGNGVLCLPCGQGKTATALAISSKLKRKTLIIVHKEFLANQWRERIVQFCPGSSIGLIQGDTWDVDGHNFVLSMIQTLCTREHSPDQFKMFGLVIVDEAHHIGAPAFSKTMFKMSPEYTLGLTATPERKDGLTCILYWFLGRIFYEMESATSSPLVLHKIDFDHESFRNGPILNKFGKVSMAHMVNHIVDIPERNVLILHHLKDAIARKRRILLLSDRRGHCEWLYEKLGPTVSGLYLGGMKQAEHEAASKKQVIVATFTLAYEGLDIPELDTLFLVTPHSDVKQAVGRIMRIENGQKEVYDFVDKWSVFNSMFYKRNKMYFPAPAPSPECLFTT